MPEAIGSPTPADHRNPEASASPLQGRAPRLLPLLGACGCGSGCSCGCQSGASCRCGGSC